MTLSEMQVNQTAKIDEVLCDSGLARRLFDMGFVSGQNITCTNIGALGTPIAYNLHGCKIALRKKDAQKLTISK